MHLYLHIGTAKTGTTSIQRFMASHRAALLERGYLYPRSPGKARHEQLSFFAKADAMVARMNEWIRFGSPDVTEFRSEFAERFRTEVT